MDPAQIRQQAEYWDKRRRTVRDLLLGEDGQISVNGKAFLDELRMFAGYGDTPFRETDRETSKAIGRQEVMQHILMLLEMNMDDIYRMYREASKEEDQDL